jgi:hypothetical protein
MNVLLYDADFATYENGMVLMGCSFAFGLAGVKYGILVRSSFPLHPPGLLDGLSMKNCAGV